MQCHLGEERKTCTQDKSDLLQNPVHGNIKLSSNLLIKLDAAKGMPAPPEPSGK
jgi:hypothetical protein